MAGLGKSAVQAVLEDHGITRVLAEEGGRTSRGSVANMRAYVEFLNGLNSRGILDLDKVEQWWVGRVRKFFAGVPFVLRFDSSKSLRAIIHDLLEQSNRRQLEFPGATFTGTVLQHLVGAKLDMLLDAKVEHHGASVADEPSGRHADFLVGDVAVHVTTAPGEAVIRKCVTNLDNNLRPIVVTMSESSPVAEGLAKQSGIEDRLDIFDAEQFLAGNLYEFGQFSRSGRTASATALIEKYNEIVAQHETDPGLQIRMG